jgi:hypothetical protein
MVRCGRRLKGSARASRGAGRDAVAPALTCRIGEATLGNQLTWRGRGSITRRRAEPRSLPLDPLSGLGRRLNFNSRVAHRPRLLRGDTRFLAMSKRGASHVRTGGLGGFNGSLPLLAPAEASARRRCCHCSLLVSFRSSLSHAKRAPAEADAPCPRR